jgi:hypothetical protein
MFRGSRHRVRLGMDHDRPGLCSLPGAYMAKSALDVLRGANSRRICITAMRLMHVIEACGNGLLALLPDLQRELSPEEFEEAKREIGRIVATTDQALSA